MYAIVCYKPRIGLFCCAYKSTCTAPHREIESKDENESKLNYRRRAAKPAAARKLPGAAVWKEPRPELELEVADPAADEAPELADPAADVAEDEAPDAFELAPLTRDDAFELAPDARLLAAEVRDAAELDAPERRDEADPDAPPAAPPL